MSPEMRPKSFGAFEKRASGTKASFCSFVVIRDMMDVFFLNETNDLIFEINQSFKLFSLSSPLVMMMFNACNTKFVICKT